jgi:hypothetical protein
VGFQACEADLPALTCHNLAGVRSGARYAANPGSPPITPEQENGVLRARLSAANVAYLGSADNAIAEARDLADAAETLADECPYLHDDGPGHQQKTWALVLALRSVATAIAAKLKTAQQSLDGISLSEEVRREEVAALEKQQVESVRMAEMRAVRERLEAQAKEGENV